MVQKKQTTPDDGEKKSRKIINRTPGQMGGARPGAGRKPGTPNKKNAALIAEVEKTGETPLQFMLRIMRDPRKPWADRMDMAKSAAPYVHAKLSSIEMSADVTTHETALEQLDG